MQKVVKYAIFKTKWGYFGLSGTEYGLIRAHLPLANPEKVKSRLLANCRGARYDQLIYKPVQAQITAYFEGAHVNFACDIPVILDGFNTFTHKVLTVCRDIQFGETVSYSALAEKVGQASAARAVGRALARNPLPLIIPCHRVIRSDGSIGGFTAEGGVTLKKRMLELEHRVTGS